MKLARACVIEAIAKLGDGCARLVDAAAEEEERRTRVAIIVANGLTPAQLEEYEAEAREARDAARRYTRMMGFPDLSAREYAEDVPILLAEIRRLREMVRQKR